VKVLSELSASGTGSMGGGRREERSWAGDVGVGKSTGFKRGHMPEWGCVGWLWFRGDAVRCEGVVCNSMVWACGLAAVIGELGDSTRGEEISIREMPFTQWREGGVGMKEEKEW